MRIVSLSEIAKLDKFTIQPDHISSGTQYVGLEHIYSEGYAIPTIVNSGELSSNKFSFNQNHILYGKLRPYLNKTTDVSFEGICSTDIIPILPDQELVDKKYLLEYLRSPNMVKFATSKCSGANLPRISPKEILQFKIPPLAQQKKIADILNAADAFRQKTKALINKYEELTQSLFLDMFGDPVTNPMGWEMVKFGDHIDVLADYHSNGSYKTLNEHVALKNSPDYALMIRTTDLENNNFESNVIYIDEHAYNYLKKSKVYGNEIIINKIGSVGKVYLMPVLNRPVSLGMNTFLLRFYKSVDTIFTYFLLKSQYGEHELQKRVKGAVTKTIRKDAIREIPIPDPLFISKTNSPDTSRLSKPRKPKPNKACKKPKTCLTVSCNKPSKVN